MDQNIDVVILAGGFGTRLKSRLGDLPKPMVKLLDKPALEWQIILCKKFGFKVFYLLVHYNYEAIINYFGDGSKWEVKIEYVIENEPRGTAGSLSDALNQLSNQFIVLYGDTYIDVDLIKMLNYHNNINSEITLLVHPNSHPNDSDLVELDENNKVKFIHSYPHNNNQYHKNLVNAALYIINKSVLKGKISKYGKSDLAKDIFPMLINSNIGIYGYQSQEYIKDLGTPERLDKIQNDILNGISNDLSLRKKRKAIFIDRDGTIIEEKKHLTKLEEIILIEDSSNAIKKINDSGYLAICVTNQPVVARGEISINELQIIHNKLDFELGRNSSYLDKLYYCPHHPDIGFDGEDKDFKILCNCRKPNIGMIENAKIELNIDIENSWIIGDTTTDIKTGKNAGLKTILVRTGFSGFDNKFNVVPDYTFSNLNEAVDWILFGYKKTFFLLENILENAQKSKLILIGGLARSSKSTISKVLSDQLLKKSIKTIVISMDGWLKPIEDRSISDDVLTRYKLQEIYIFIKELISINDNKEITIPIYDRLTKKIIFNEKFMVGKNDIIILEGVPALCNPDLNQLSNLKLFVSIDENVRKERMKIDYLSRAILKDEFESIYSVRQKDEHEIIIESKNNANYII